MALSTDITEAIGDMGYVSLSKMPSPKKEYVVSFERLSGGLNLNELDYRIGNDETPEMKNLLWLDGVLSCRDGQVWVNSVPGDELYAAYEALWNGKMFIHSGTKLYCVNPETGVKTELFSKAGMTEGGTFFPYGENLYYKTKGSYVVITYDGTTFSASGVSGYVPVTLVNCSPVNGSGDVYQPENRISSKKELWYNAEFTLTSVVVGDLVVSIEDSYFRMRINTPGSYVFSYTTEWQLDGETVDPLDYGITVGGTPASGNSITVKLTFTDTYYLPVKDADVSKVVVDEVELTPEGFEITCSREELTATVDAATWRGEVNTSGNYTFVYASGTDTWSLDNVTVDLDDYGVSYSSTSIPALVDTDSITVSYEKGDYWVDTEAGAVHFYTAPPVTYPETNNTVQITYDKPNPVAEANIMDCTIVATYGGTGALCVVMAGCSTQPNAYFWNGQTTISMDPTYFPMTQYQLAGNAVDAITGFGKQQGYLIIFKDGSVGRTSLETTTADDRLAIDLPYTNINAKIGCDLPKTIQLIENNLTWCNTTQGVHFLANTSSAYENNVVCLSNKINESSDNWTQGLLYDVRNNSVKAVVSHDDEKRYWLVAGDHVWLWDYYLSNYKDPSWFYFDNIKGRAFIQKDDVIWHFDAQSRLTKFERVFYDYDPSENGNGAINKVFRFATQYFGTYDNLKTVNSVIINTRSDTNSIVDLYYMTDYEERRDLTQLQGIAWALVPRNLERRVLTGSGFAHVFRRKPHCRRVHYFTMRLENSTPTMDMSIVSAQIYYTYQGRYR